ncbi:MAG: polyprenol monophosphomannose synthase [Deltaproteobacteria bacterium]|nr:polyprenol monophosphomannose synthase [Candidatus Zymogenaceae bacterium]
MKPTTLMMIPTYNEADNIKDLIEAVLAQSPEMGVVIVDDDSPDGTADIVRSLGKRGGRIELIVRKNERGRGSAGIVGFRHALGVGARYIGEMDADFSHDPKYIKDFLRLIKSYDIVIGSRGIPGGGEVRRSPVRRMITAFASVYIHTLLGLKVKDPTSGYRLFRREVVKTLDWDTMVSVGPSIVQEMLIQALTRGWSVVEFPIVFSERRAGSAKFSLRISVQSLVTILRFRIKYGKIRLG